MTSDLVQKQVTADDVACAAAVQDVRRYFTDQGWTYPPARVELATQLIGTLGRYITDALEHSGRMEASDLDRRFELVCALTGMAYEQRRLYWLLERWARDCAPEGTLDPIAAFSASHRFSDARKHVTALGDALAVAHNHIGQDCDRSCEKHERMACRIDEDHDNWW